MQTLCYNVCLRKKQSCRNTTYIHSRIQSAQKHPQAVKATHISVNNTFAFSDDIIVLVYKEQFLLKGKKDSNSDENATDSTETKIK